jgi:hypothetical protein
MSLPPAYLSQKLPQPLPTKGGAVLRTIGDVRAYMIVMPAAHDGCARWLHAAKLILGQADVAAVSRQVYLASGIWTREQASGPIPKVDRSMRRLPWGLSSPSISKYSNLVKVVCRRARE